MANGSSGCLSWTSIMIYAYNIYIVRLCILYLCIPFNEYKIMHCTKLGSTYTSWLLSGLFFKKPFRF